MPVAEDHHKTKRTFSFLSAVKIKEISIAAIQLLTCIDDKHSLETQTIVRIRCTIQGSC